ncbi:hypothetical protein ABZX40_23655 [Streptomyces sp. NPDC004610]
MTEQPPTTKEKPPPPRSSDGLLWSGALMLLVWSSVFAFVMSVVLAHSR